MCKFFLPLLYLPPLVMMSSPKQRMLQRAAELVGHEELAARLNVPLTLLDLWIRGLAPMPDRKLLPLADLLEMLAQARSREKGGR